MAILRHCSNRLTHLSATLRFRRYRGRSPAARITVAPIRDQLLQALPRPSDSTGALHPDRVEDHLELGAFVALTRSDDHRQRPASTVAGGVQFGRQPAAAPPKRLVLRVRPPLFATCLLGFRRAPAACWCARVTVLPTLIGHVHRPGKVHDGGGSRFDGSNVERELSLTYTPIREALEEEIASNRR